MNSKLEQHLKPGEKVIWNDKPVRKAFILPGLAYIPFGIIFLGFSLFVWTTALSGAPYFGYFFLLPFILGAIALMFGPSILQLMRYNNTEYMITDKRIITQTGAIGLDTRFVDFEKIQEVFVQIGIADRIFGTGTLIAMTAGFSGFYPTGKQGCVGAYGGMHGLRPSFSALREPYRVQKLLQEAMERAKQTQE
jgi:membrane protein YdbS with pleckstrin-like domain